MPGYVIHLAVAKRYAEENKMTESKEFIQGVIAPDLLKQKGIDSHYGASNSIDFNEFFKYHKIDNDYEKGYFLHLVTDYIFYKKLADRWTPDIYRDYGILNKSLVEKYEIDLPEEVKECAKFISGNLSILNLEDTIKFIEDTSKVNLNKFMKAKTP